MITFQLEKWSEARGEIIQRWPEHYLEAYQNDDYNPDLLTYDALALAGQLLVITGRHGKTLVGYTISFIKPHLHQQHLLWGMIDSYWLHKECRAPRVFPRLLKTTESEMKKLGVRRIFGCERLEGRVFAYMGYCATERVYIKEIP